MEKNLWNEWEKLALRVSKIFYQNNDKTLKFIGQKNIAVGVCQACRSTRAVDRQRSEIRPLEPRSTARVDRATGAESRSLCRSTRTVGRNSQRAELSGAVDPYGRPSSSAQRRAHLCTSVDRARSADSCISRLLKVVSRLIRSLKQFSGIKKFVFFGSNKIP